MLVALDVSYDETNNRALAAAVVFRHWQDRVPLAEHTVSQEEIQPYVPGSFYRRELPCLLEVLRKVKGSIDLVLVDSYVMLGDKPGLGAHLWEATSRRFPVVGVAKSPYREAPAIEVLRGNSNKPLFVSAVGMDAMEAAEKVRTMHGPYRVPTLLRRADALTRK